jgi:hypothetical protein
VKSPFFFGGHPVDVHGHVLGLHLIDEIVLEKIHVYLSMGVCTGLVPGLDPGFEFGHVSGGFVIVHKTDQRNLAKRAAELVLIRAEARDVGHECRIACKTFTNKFAEKHLLRWWLFFSKYVTVVPLFRVVFE